MIRRITATLLLGLGLAGCGGMSGADTATSNTPTAAPSGITAANGGGQRQLGNLPSVGFTNGTATIGNVPNSKGNSY